MTAHPEERAAKSIDADPGGWERIASTALGGALVLYGLGRRSIVGTVAALAGGVLLYRGVRGNDRPSTSGTSVGDAAERRESGAAGGVEVERSVTVERPADELYEIWRDPQQLSRIVGRAGEVTDANDDRQRWTVDAPLGRSVEWETRIVEERPGELLRWESLAGSRVSGEGSLRFREAPGDRGTEVTLSVRVDPPGGALGSSVIERLNVAPDAVVGEALRRFKSLAETGEIPSTEHNPSARGRGDLV